MSDTTKITIGIIGVLIFGGLGAYLLTPEQLEKSFTCTTNNVTGIFDKFSTTNITAYWVVNGVTKQSVCTKGKWIKTTEWLKINGLTAEDITISSVDESNMTEDYAEIVGIGQTIVVSESKIVSINDVKYNITFIPKTVTKCICDIVTGCKIKDCI